MFSQAMQKGRVDYALDVGEGEMRFVEACGEAV